jgi:hypothetical protein
MKGIMGGGRDKKSTSANWNNIFFSLYSFTLPHLYTFLFFLPPLFLPYLGYASVFNPSGKRVVQRKSARK